MHTSRLASPATTREHFEPPMRQRPESCPDIDGGALTSPPMTSAPTGNGCAVSEATPERSTVAMATGAEAATLIRLETTP